MDGLDRARRVVKIAPTYDETSGEELIPRREIAYDTLVIAVGSHTNDFGTPGAREHAISLDTPDRRRALPPPADQRLHTRERAGRAAAPGAAQRRHHRRRRDRRGARRRAAQDHARARGLRLRENRSGARHPADDHRSGPRILPALPERVALAAQELLRSLDVEVLTGERVTEVRPTRVDHGERPQAAAPSSPCGRRASRRRIS